MVGGTRTVKTVSFVALPAAFSAINEYVPWSPGYCGLTIESVEPVTPEIVELPLGPGPLAKSTPLYCQCNVGTGEPETASTIKVVTPLVVVIADGPVTFGAIGVPLIVSNAALLVFV